MNDRQGGATLEREDLRAALREMKTYVDVTEEDLKRIYEIALRHAQQRMAAKIPVQEVMTGNVVAVGRTLILMKRCTFCRSTRSAACPW